MDSSEAITAQTDLQVIVVRIVETKGPDKRGIETVLLNGCAPNTAVSDFFDCLFEPIRRIHRDAVARGSAGRSRNLDARQVEADDILARQDIGMARRAIGIFPPSEKCQAKSFLIELLRAIQVPHRNADMIQGFGSKHGSSSSDLGLSLSKKRVEDLDSFLVVFGSLFKSVDVNPRRPKQGTQLLHSGINGIDIGIGDHPSFFGDHLLAGVGEEKVVKKS